MELFQDPSLILIRLQTLSNSKLRFEIYISIKYNSPISKYKLKIMED